MPQRPESLKPLNDFVLIEEEPPVTYDQYKGYIHLVLPDKFSHGPEDRQVIGKVLEKGELCRDGMVSIGDRVVIGKWDGARFPREGHTYMLVKEDSLLAVIT